MGREWAKLSDAKKEVSVGYLFIFRILCNYLRRIVRDMIWSRLNGISKEVSCLSLLRGRDPRCRIIVSQRKKERVFLKI